MRIARLSIKNFRGISEGTLTLPDHAVLTGATNGTTAHAAPFQHQGNGTINMLVLALLSMIADAKETVIFAMEEPEIAIPPATQKRIINGVRSKAAQAIFTSHSPYVLEEFSPNQILALQRDESGKLSGKPYDNVSVSQYRFYRDEPMSPVKHIALAARQRLRRNVGEDWSLAILVKSREMMLRVSSYLDTSSGRLPQISHDVLIDPEGPALAAVLIGVASLIRIFQTQTIGA